MQLKKETHHLLIKVNLIAYAQTCNLLFWQTKSPAEKYKRPHNLQKNSRNKSKIKRTFFQ